MLGVTGACVVVIRHLNKTGGANPLYRGGGSIGIIGAARAAMIVAPDPEDAEFWAATLGTYTTVKDTERVQNASRLRNERRDATASNCEPFRG